MPVAYSYIRWSSKAQGPDRGGDSLRRQLSLAEKYAAKHRLDLDTSYRDEGVSSMRGEHRLRGALASFLAHIEKGHVKPGDFLLIDGFDRLGRESEMTMVNLMSGICLRGVKIVTLNDERVYDEKSRTEDLIVALISISRAHEENLRRGERVRLAHEESKRRAREEGRVWHKSGPHWLRAVVTGAGQDRLITFEPIPARVAIVQKIFRLMDDGLGTQAVAMRLNDDGDPTPKHGRKWDHSTVLAIAKSRTVLGEYQPKRAVGNNRATGRPVDGDPVPGYYGAGIIDPVLFQRVQERIASRNTRAGRGGGRNLKQLNNLFTGLVRCHTCKGVMGYHTAHDGKKGWGRSSALQCVNARLRNGCDHRTRYPYPAVESAILKHVREFDLCGPKVSSAEEIALAEAELRRADIEGEIANLIKLAATGSKAVGDAILKREQELEAQDDLIKSLRIKLAAHRKALPPGEARDALPPLLAQMARAEGDELYSVRARVSEAVRAIVDEIEFHPGLVDDTPIMSVMIVGGALTYGFAFKDKTFTPVGGGDVIPFIKIGVLKREDYTNGAPARERELDRIIAAHERRIASVFGFWSPKTRSLTVFKDAALN